MIDVNYPIAVRYIGYKNSWDDEVPTLAVITVEDTDKGHDEAERILKFLGMNDHIHGGFSVEDILQ